MEKVRFGKTGLMVSKVAFGGIPIQRLSVPDAVAVVRGVIDLGVNFIDTAIAYTDSEEKIGIAIKGIKRDSLVIATKSGAADKKTFLENLDTSLKKLGTDYIDIYQHHGLSPEKHDKVFGEDGAYEGMLEAIKAGKVRFPAFSSHDIPHAVKVMKEGKFACVQLPINYVDIEAEEEAIPLAKEMDIGFIAMKPFGGGMLSDARLSMKYISQFDHLVPDPGIEKLSEMEEIVQIVNSLGPFTPEDAAEIARVRAELGVSWCHRCNYCQPCPANVQISTALTIERHTRRFLFPKVVENVGAAVESAKHCVQCRVCVERCPYKLDIPTLLKKKLDDWDKFVAANQK